MRPIFCGNFEYDARQSELERLFRRYGRVERVDMKSGFAFIYMEDERDAEDAIKGLDRVEFGRKGRRLRVEWTKQERGIRRPGGSSSRRSGNSRPSKTLFVINFDPNHTRTKDLERHFESYGRIVSVRIRRNFAFVQYELQDDATRALEATNMSKLLDRVISVEYAVRDDDERRDGYSPDRVRDRSPDGRGHDRRRSPSPYRRERGSPDYGRGSSPGPYRKDRLSPEYGRRRSPSPDFGRAERGGSDHRDADSPYRRDRMSHENGRGAVQSPYGRDGNSPDMGNGRNRSPPRRARSPADDGDGSRSRSRSRSRSPYGANGSSPGEKTLSNTGRGGRDDQNYSGADSPMQDHYNSPSPRHDD